MNDNTTVNISNDNCDEGNINDCMKYKVHDKDDINNEDKEKEG